MDVDVRAGSNVVAAEGIVGDELADGEGDGRDVAEGFAAYVVEVVKLVGVGGGEVVWVFPGSEVEEKGHVVANFRAQLFLDLRVLREEVKGPGDAGGRGIMASAKEGHDLAAHGFKAEFFFASFFSFAVVLNHEGDDVFAFGVRFGQLEVDDLGSYGNDSAAG